VVVFSNLLRATDTRIPTGWNISAGGLAVPPVPVGARLEALIYQRRDALSEEERADPSFAANSELWPAIFTEERVADVARYVGPYPPDRHNRVEWRTCWRGRTIEGVLQAYNKGSLRSGPPHTLA
jgi:hypothetical protein